MSDGVDERPLAMALVPTRNAESFVEATLAALASQTYPCFQVLVSDDASTDGTVSICETFAATDSRFRVIRQENHLGWAGNVNALLRAARGEYLFFAAHDDLLAPAYVASLVQALEQDTDAVLAFSDGEMLKIDGTIVSWSFRDLDGVDGAAARAGPICQQRPGSVVPYRGLFRATAAERVGGLREHWAGECGADRVWLLGMALLGRLVRVPKQLFRKVDRRDSLSRGWVYGPWSKMCVLLSCAGVVRRAGLLPSHEVRLHLQLAQCYAIWLWNERFRTKVRLLVRLLLSELQKQEGELPATGMRREEQEAERRATKAEILKPEPMS